MGQCQSIKITSIVLLNYTKRQPIIPYNPPPPPPLPPPLQNHQPKRLTRLQLKRPPILYVTRYNSQFSSILDLDQWAF